MDVIPPESYDSFTDLYLVFEFLDTDLHKLIMSPQYLSIRHIQVFLYQLLCGLKYIHSANVIHRDMKPANILLNEDCTLKVRIECKLIRLHQSIELFKVSLTLGMFRRALVLHRSATSDFLVCWRATCPWRS